jgi:hypothetical protein
MDIPVGQDVEIPVRLVLVGEPFALVPAVLLRVDATALRLRVDPSGGATLGRRAVVAFADQKLPGRITAVDGPNIALAREEAHGTDDRAAPRVHAPLTITWWRASDPSARREAEADDLSVSGLRFAVSSDPPSSGESVVLTARLGGKEAHRLVAVVRRVAPVDGGWSIAAEFADMDEAAFEALSDLTLANL